MLYYKEGSGIMAKMYEVNQEKYNQPKHKKIIIKLPKTKVRNELHFMACRDNISYVAKDKTKIIPRKRKYKENYMKEVDKYE